MLRTTGTKLLLKTVRIRNKITRKNTATPWDPGFLSHGPFEKILLSVSLSVIRPKCSAQNFCFHLYSASHNKTPLLRHGVFQIAGIVSITWKRETTIILSSIERRGMGLF